MDIDKLMQQAQQMQSQLQETLGQIDVTQSVGGGMVEVKMSGEKKLTSLTIDPEVLDPDDPEMVQDLVLTAVNAASKQVDEKLKNAVGGIAPGIGLPGL